MERERIPNQTDIQQRFLSEHRLLRGKAAVVASLALTVLRGDGDLAPGLRRKGLELNKYLLQHMDWEETHLAPLLAKSSTDGLSSTILVRQHLEQRRRIFACLNKLGNRGTSNERMAGDCLEIIHWLEVDMEDEEREVLSSIADAD